MSRWKQGDTQPPLVIDCFDGSGQAADLGAATTVKVVVTQRGVLRWQRTIPPSQVSGGTVTMPLQSADTATVGTFFVKVYVAWPDGSHQNYPPADEYMTITVTR